MATKKTPSEEERSIMTALMSKLTERQLAKMGAPNVTRLFTRRMIQDSFLETFELVGGVNRLALWANDPENYDVFLKLLMQLAPKEAPADKGARVINYKSNVPSSALNDNTKIDQDVADA